MKSPNSSDPWIGRLIGERQRYRLEKRLGVGGMGDVFLAMDTLLGQHVALKILKGNLVTYDEFRKRFEREVAVSAALKSDHIVQVSDYGITNEGYPFYVMEYLRGESLGQLLRREGRLSIERSINIITQVCDGLYQAHQGVTLWRNGATVREHIKVTHRDLKPDNIFLVSTVLGELVKILDFGIAKIRDYTAEQTELTENRFLGTYHYASPEQLEIKTGIDGRTDIYSLGIILYEMISGTDAFGLGLNKHTINETSWIIAHATKPPQPLQSQPGLTHIPPELEAAVMRCLQKVPSERFAAVDELKLALQAVITPQPLTPNSRKQSINQVLTTPPSVVLPTGNENIQARPVELHTPNQESQIQTVNQILAALDEGFSDEILTLEQESLLEIIAEILGPITPTLTQEISVYAVNTKELLENLMLYLSEQQRIQFQKKAILLLQRNFKHNSTKTPDSQTTKHQVIDPQFLVRCQEYLTEVIGPIAPLLIQPVLMSNPQISSEELVNILAKEISNPKKAQEFSQRLLNFE
jgi:serine/threonine-protein kinase